MTLQSQLDQVLALIRGMPCRCMSVAQLGERDPGCDRCQIADRLSAIRAAVGNIRDAVTDANMALALEWARQGKHPGWEEHLPAIEEAITAYTPPQVRTAQRVAAVGGEAVAWRMLRANGKPYTGWIELPVPEWASINVDDGMRLEYAYASPPTTVDVGALRHIVAVLVGSQQQCDEDGQMIAVSRQALDELAALIGG